MGQNFAATAAQREVGIIGEGRGLDVHLDDARARGDGLIREGRGGIDDGRGATDQQQIALTSGTGGAVDGVNGQRLSKPDYGGTHQASTGALRWKRSERHRAIFFFAAAAKAANAPQTAVQFDDVATAGGAVEAVDILRDEGEFGSLLLEAGERAMTWIGLGGGDALAAPVVPFPGEFGIAREGFRSSELLGPVVVPQAARAAESGDAALGGNAGAGENGDGAGGSEPGASLGEWIEAEMRGGAQNGESKRSEKGSQFEERRGGRQENKEARKHGSREQSGPMVSPEVPELRDGITDRGYREERMARARAGREIEPSARVGSTACKRSRMALRTCSLRAAR